MSASLSGGEDEAREIEVEASCESDVDPPPTLLRYHLLKIGREAMTNALKHGSGAPRLRIEVTRARMTFALENPIAPETAERPIGVNRGRGSQNLESRVKALGGNLEARREADHFRLRVEVPLPIKYPEPETEGSHR